MARGVSAGAHISVAAARCLILQSVQVPQLRGDTGVEGEVIFKPTMPRTEEKVRLLVDPEPNPTALVMGIVSDTGATVRGVGNRHMGMLENEKPLNAALQIAGAGGDVRVDTKGDLPIRGALAGSMDDSLVFHDCQESILPVVPICEELDLGYQIAQGGGQGRFYKDGQTAQVLTKEGQLFTVPIEDMGSEQWYDCDPNLDMK
jgi:hypothetical protein